MQSTEIQYRSLSFTNSRTYFLAAIFIIGNLLLPQLLHLVPQGGNVWLPIFFFTLVAAYRCGWKVGLLTAIASPLLNSLVFGMPAVDALPLILVKSVALAVIADKVSRMTGTVTLLSLLLVIVSYQSVGVVCECILCGSLSTALTSLRISIPGMLVQLSFGYLLIRKL